VIWRRGRAGDKAAWINLSRMHEDSGFVTPVAGGANFVHASEVDPRDEGVPGADGASGDDGASGGDEVSGGEEVSGGDEVPDSAEVSGGEEVSGGDEVPDSAEVSGGEEVSGGDEAPDSVEVPGGDEVSGGEEVSGGDEVPDSAEVSGDDEVSGGDEAPGSGEAADAGEAPDRAERDRRALIDLVIYAYDRTTSTGVRARLAEGLDRVGVRTVEPDGEPFDAAQHEAGGVEPTDDEALHDHIAETERAGFRDGNRLIREPTVVVYRRR
jgi:hypothetical protein